MLRNTHTIFSISSLSRILLGSGALLVCLLVIVRPEASLGLGVARRTVFWVLHVGTGIAAMFVASQLIRHSLLSQLNIMPSVILCGVTGTLLITPFYLLIDHLWPVSNVEEIDGWLDQLHQTGIFGTLIAEFLEVLPWTMTAWLMINLPLLNQPLLNRLTGNDNQSDLSREHSVQSISIDSGTEEPTDRPGNTGNLTVVKTTSGSTNHDTSSSAMSLAPVSRILDQPATYQTPDLNRNVDDCPQPLNTTRQPDNPAQFLQSLPGIFGKDIIAISSDLHYLNVFTLVGKTTILGNLRDVATELQDTGLQVHRSHWVAHKHVDRIVNTGGQAACIMSNSIRIPVSRRRWKTVRNFYGQGVINRSPENQSATKGHQ